MAMAAVLTARTALIAAVIMAALAFIAGCVMGQADSPRDCVNPIVSLSPCLTYLTGLTDLITSSSDCCIALDQVIHGKTDCLCELFSTTDFLGFPLNQSRGLSLPTACNLSIPSHINHCKGIQFTPAGGPSEVSGNLAPKSSRPASGFTASNPSQPPTQTETPAPFLSPSSAVLRPIYKPSFPSIETGSPSGASSLGDGHFSSMILAGILAAAYCNLSLM